MMENELKPCPFCGGQASIKHYESKELFRKHIQYSYVKCNTCVRKDCPDRKEQNGLEICVYCDDYLDHEPTNADRIRAMSDEELVEHFWESMPDEKFCTGICNDQNDCDVCRLAWLKQPAEVD